MKWPPRSTLYFHSKHFKGKKRGLLSTIYGFESPRVISFAAIGLLKNCQTHIQPQFDHMLRGGYGPHIRPYRRLTFDPQQTHIRSYPDKNEQPVQQRNIWPFTLFDPTSLFLLRFRGCKGSFHWGNLVLNQPFRVYLGGGGEHSNYIIKHCQGMNCAPASKERRPWQNKPKMDQFSIWLVQALGSKSVKASQVKALKIC